MLEYSPIQLLNWRALLQPLQMIPLDFHCAFHILGVSFAADGEEFSDLKVKLKLTKSNLLRI